MGGQTGIELGFATLKRGLQVYEVDRMDLTLSDGTPDTHANIVFCYRRKMAPLKDNHTKTPMQPLVYPALI